MTAPTKLLAYFSQSNPVATNVIGAEIETSFVDSTGRPISVAVSQSIMHSLVCVSGWSAVSTKGTDGSFIASVQSPAGDLLSYELGCQNLELATVPFVRSELVGHTLRQLADVYQAASANGALPFHGPILDTDKDLLVLPDKRDATWLALDGRAALRPLTTISSVQFTIPVTVDTVIPILNRLLAARTTFLSEYPQDSIWHDYTRVSLAGYRANRYGGPDEFLSLEDYCEQLAQHDVVVGSKLRPIGTVADLDIPLFIRSVWWYFRLRRHGDQLCIEVRPLARGNDQAIAGQLEQVLDIAYG